MAPPLSSTSYVIPSMYNLVPNSNSGGAAIVWFGDAFLPLAVIPSGSTFPVHFSHGQ